MVRRVTLCRIKGLGKGTRIARRYGKMISGGIPAFDEGQANGKQRSHNG